MMHYGYFVPLLRHQYFALLITGPFTINQVFPYGTVELSQPNGPNFKVNGHRVKHYFGGDIPSKDSPFDLVAYTDSDYAKASLDRKSTIGGCQFLGCRLISWQCKKQTVVANSTTEAEYIAASNHCRQAYTYYCQLKVNVMYTLTTVDDDVHNLVAFLSKPIESEGFEQIIDFLNVNPIKYALMVNPTVYTSSQEEELGEGFTMPSAPQHTPIIQPSTSKPKKKQKPRKSKGTGTINTINDEEMFDIEITKRLRHREQMRRSAYLNLSVYVSPPESTLRLPLFRLACLNLSVSIYQPA
uniref:Putative ribonuclease H-like domain-containing protein n=1 Tax=Tanacetum cinerariifolium TaxID=118510 RepID=A0A699HG36_TANCI|nr:putative ribonuclease H-like domain-containing protein [Tanacetum cinerariifolium]